MRRTFVLIISLVALGSLFHVLPQENQAGGLFVVIVNDKRGYIDRTGKMIIKPQFNGASGFSEGLAQVAISDNGYAEGYIDETGKIVIRPQFDKVSAFSEGLALVGFNESKMEIQIGDKTYMTSSSHPSYKWGYIDKTGKYIVEPKYSIALDFSEGLAAVKEPEGKFVFIDKAGHIAIPQQFEFASSFSEGLACVMINGKYGFIDKSGKIIIKAQFTSPGGFRDGLALMRVGGKTVDPRPNISVIGPLGGKYVFIDRSGNSVIKLGVEVDNAHPFSEGLATIEVKKKDGYLYCGYIGASGETIIDPKFGGCEDFSDGVALIINNGKFHYIDKAGNIIITTPYDMAWDFHDGLAFIQSGDDVRDAKYGYIDKTGKVIWQPSR